MGVPLFCVGPGACAGARVDAQRSFERLWLSRRRGDRSDRRRRDAGARRVGRALDRDERGVFNRADPRGDARSSRARRAVRHRSSRARALASSSIEAARAAAEGRAPLVRCDRLAKVKSADGARSRGVVRIERDTRVTSAHEAGGPSVEDRPLVLEREALVGSRAALGWTIDPVSSLGLRGVTMRGMTLDRTPSGWFLPGPCFLVGLPSIVRRCVSRPRLERRWSARSDGMASRELRS